MRTHVEAVESRRFLTATATGAVFVDTWGNGVNDAGYDPGLANATAYFDLNHDAKYQSSEPHGVTNSVGQFKITDARLNAGVAYSVGFVLPSGYHLSVGDLTLVTPLYSANSDLGRYATFKYATVKITSYLDVNKNAKHDSGEPAFYKERFYDDVNRSGHYEAGEPVTAYGGSTLTMKPGIHQITQDYPFPTDGYQSTNSYIGGIQPNSGQTVNLDFGFYYPARYSGYVYQDKNKNGKYDTGEGIAGRSLFGDANNDGRQNVGESGARTDASGYYVIGLNPGTVYLRQTLATNWTGSGAQKLYVAGSTTVISIGHNFTTQPSSTPTTGSISGYFFLDANKTGKQESGEAQYKVPDVTWEQGRVFIDLNHNGYLDNDELKVVEANPDGTFSFTGLLPGSYWVQPYAGFGTLDSTSPAARVTVTAGQNATANFGVWHSTQVNMWAINDNDNDGTYSGGDTATPGVTIYADLNNNGKLDAGEPSTAPHDVTNPEPGGTIKLPDGTYRMRAIVPAGYHLIGYGTNYLGPASTFTTDGILRLPADNPYHSELLNLYFRSLPDAVVTGKVFNDNNGNGKQDAGDTASGRGGFIYTDLNNNGQQDGGEAAVVPNADGTFALHLAPGAYTLRQQLEPGWTPDRRQRHVRDDRPRRANNHRRAVRPKARSRRDEIFHRLRPGDRRQQPQRPL